MVMVMVMVIQRVADVLAAVVTRDMKTMCKTLTFDSTGVEKMMFQARFEN